MKKGHFIVNATLDMNLLENQSVEVEQIIESRNFSRAGNIEDVKIYWSVIYVVY